jgi:phosphatidate phosphatase PAH1
VIFVVTINSDLLWVGRDWAQSGVAELFTKIRNNGYHIMYLSARAIGQATITKDYLQSVKQARITTSSLLNRQELQPPVC